MVHPVLTTTALGLLVLGTSLDMLSAGRAGGLTWLAFWTTTAGVAWGTWCAVWAMFDWIFFARLGDAGVWGADGFASAVVVGLYALSTLLRLDDPARPPSDAARALEVAGAAVLGVRLWIGRELAGWLSERP
jgi:hypothetical protein